MVGTTNTLVGIEEFIIRDNGFDDNAWGGDLVDVQEFEPFFTYIEQINHPLKGKLPLPNRPARPWDLETWPLGKIGDSGIASLSEIGKSAATPVTPTPLPADQEPLAFPLSPLPEITGKDNQPRSGAFKDDYSQPGAFKRFEFKNLLPTDSGHGNALTGKDLLNTFLADTFDRWLTPPDHETAAGFIGLESPTSIDALTGDRVEHFINERTEFRQDNQIQVALFLDINGTHTNTSWQELLDQMRLIGLDTNDETDCIFATRRYSYQPPINPDTFVNHKSYIWSNYLQNSTAASSFEPISGLSGSTFNFAPGTISVNSRTLTVSTVDATLFFLRDDIIRIRGEQLTVSAIIDSSTVKLVEVYQGLEGSAFQVPIGLDRPIYHVQEVGDFIDNGWTQNNFWSHIDDLNSSETTLLTEGTFLRGKIPIIELNKDVVSTGQFDAGTAPKVQMWPLEYIDVDSTGLPTSVEFDNGVGDFDTTGFDDNFEFNFAISAASSGGAGAGAFFVASDVAATLGGGIAFNVVDSGAGNDGLYTASASGAAFNASSGQTRVPVVEAVAGDGGGGRMLSTSSLGIGFDNETDLGVLRQGIVPSFIQPVLEYTVSELNTDESATAFDEDLRIRAQRSSLDSAAPYVLTNGLIDSFFSDFPRKGRLLGYATQLTDSENQLRSMWEPTKISLVAPTQNSEGEWNVAENFKTNIQKENPETFTTTQILDHFTNILITSASAAQDAFRDGRNWRNHPDRTLGNGGEIFQYEHNLDWWAALMFQEDSDPNTVLAFAREEHLRRNNAVRGIIERLSSNLTDQSKVITQPQFRALVLEELRTLIEGVVPNPFFDSTNGIPNFIATPAHFGLFLAEEPGFVYDHVTGNLRYRGILGEVIDLPFGTTRPDSLDLIYHDIQTYLFDSVPTRFRKGDRVINEDRIGRWDIENLYIFSGDGTTGTFTLPREVEGAGQEFISVVVNPDDYVWGRARVEILPGTISDVYSLSLNDKIIFAPQASANSTGNEIASDLVNETKHAITSVTVPSIITIAGNKSLAFLPGKFVDIVNSTSNDGTFEIQGVTASSFTSITLLTTDNLDATPDGSVILLPELDLRVSFDGINISQEPTRGTTFTIDIVGASDATVTVSPPVIPAASDVVDLSGFTTVPTNIVVNEVPTPAGGTIMQENDDFILLANKRDIAFSLKSIPASGVNNLAVVEFAFSRKYDAEQPPETQFKIIPGELVFDINNFVFSSPDDESLVRCYTASTVQGEEEIRFLKWTQRRTGGFIQEFSEPFENILASNDPFTWNYRDDAAQISAYWWDIYCNLFGTSGPHFEPWIIQGYSEKPGWWETDFPRTEEGLYPYSDMWQRIQDGKLQIGHLGIGSLNGEVLNPSENLPINFNTGSILPPFSSDFNSVFASIPAGRFNNFEFGDNAPAEKEWRDTLDFRWDIVEIGYTLKPLDFISRTWDSERLLTWKNEYTYDGATGRKTDHKNMVFFGEEEDLISREKNFAQFLFCADGSTIAFSGTSFTFSPIEEFDGNGTQTNFILERGFNEDDFSLVQVGASILQGPGSVVGGTIIDDKGFGLDYAFSSAQEIQFDTAPGAGVAFIGNEWDCSINASATASIIGILRNIDAAAGSFGTHFPASTFHISASASGDTQITDIRVPEAATFTASLIAADYWTIGAPGTSYYVWYSVVGGSAVPTDPAPGGTGIEIILSNTSNSALVATETASAINAVGDFTATSSSAVVTVTTVPLGSAGLAVDVTAGVTPTTIRFGPQGGFEHSWNFGGSPLSIGASNAQIFVDGVLAIPASVFVFNSSNISINASTVQTVDIRIGAFEIAGDHADDFLAGIFGASSDTGGGIEFTVISTSAEDGVRIVGPVDSIYNASTDTTVIPVLGSVTSTAASGTIIYSDSCITNYDWDLIGWDDQFVGDSIPIKVKLGSPAGDLSFDGNDTLEVYVQEGDTRTQISPCNFTASVIGVTVTLSQILPEFTILNFLVFNPLSIREKDDVIREPKRINGINQWYSQFYKARGKEVGLGTEYDLHWKNWDPRGIYRTDHILNADSVITQALSTQLERNTDFRSEIDKTQGIRDFYVDVLQASIINKTETTTDTSGSAPTSTIWEIDNFDDRRNSVTTAVAREDKVYLFNASALTPAQILSGSTILFSGVDLNGSVLEFRSRDETSVIIDGSVFLEHVTNVREQKITLTASALSNSAFTATTQAQILIEPPIRNVFSQSTDKEFITGVLIQDDIPTNTFVKGTVEPTKYIQPLEFEADSRGDLATKEIILPARFTGAQALFTFLSEYERYLLEQGAIFDFPNQDGEDAGEFNDWTLQRKKFIRFVDRLELYFNDPTQKLQSIKLNPIDIIARIGTTTGLVAPLESDSDFFSKKSQAILDVNGFLVGPRKTQVLRNDDVTSVEVIPGSTTRRFFKNNTEFTPKFVQSVDPLAQGKLVLNGEIWFDTINDKFFSYDSDGNIFIPSTEAEPVTFTAIIEPLTIHTIHWVIDNYEHIIRFNNETSTGRRIYDPLTGRVIDRIHVEFERSRTHSGRPNLGGFILNRDDSNNLVVTRNIEGQVQGHRDLYDVYRVPLDNKFDRAIPELIGLESTPFLDNLVGGNSRRTQIGFHQGFIQQKGARDNIDAFTKAIRSLKTFELEEIFAYKVGEFGEKQGDDFVKVKISENEGNRSILGIHFTDTSLLESFDPQLIEVKENDPERFTQLLDKDSTSDGFRFYFPAIQEESVFSWWEQDNVQEIKNKGGNTLGGIAGDFGTAVSTTSALFDIDASTFVTGSNAVAGSSFFGVDFGSKGPGGFIEDHVVAGITLNQGPQAASQVQVQFSTASTTDVSASALTWENLGSPVNVSGVDGRLDQIILPAHTTSARFWRIISTVISSSNWDVRSLEFHKYRPQPDYEKIGKVGAFNNKTSSRVAAWYPWDPAEGVHPPSVNQYIDNDSSIDPALYNFVGSSVNSQARLDSDRSWGEEHVGETWWDKSIWGTIDYKDGRKFATDSQRASAWGKLAPGKKVAVYEWVRSEITPTAWDALVKQNISNPGSVEEEDLPDGDIRNSTDFTKDIIVQDDGTQKIFYYFWVTNRTSRGFTKQGNLRDFTISQITAGLEDPNTLTENTHYHVDTFKIEAPSTGEGGWDGAEWDFSGWDIDVGIIPDRFSKWFGNRGDLVFVNDNIELQFERHFLLTGNPKPDGGLLGVRHEEWELIRRNQNSLPPTALWDQIVSTAKNSQCEFLPGVDNAKNNSECIMDQGDLLRLLNKRIPEIKSDFIPEGFEAISPISENSTPTFEEGTPYDGAITPTVSASSTEGGRDIRALGEPTKVFLTPGTPDNTENLLGRDSVLSFWNVASANAVTELFFDVLDEVLAGDRERNDIFKTSWVSFDVQKELVQDAEFTESNADINLALDFLNSAGKPFHTHINEEFSKTAFTVSENMLVQIVDLLPLAVSSIAIPSSPILSTYSDALTVTFLENTGAAFNPLSMPALIAASTLYTEEITASVGESIRIAICHGSTTPGGSQGEIGGASIFYGFYVIHDGTAVASGIPDVVLAGSAGGTFAPPPASGTQPLYVIGGSSSNIDGTHIGVGGTFSDVWQFTGANDGDALSASIGYVWTGSTTLAASVVDYLVLNASQVEINASVGQTVTLRLGNFMIGKPLGAGLDPSPEDWFRFDGVSFASAGTGYEWDGVGFGTTLSSGSAATFIKGATMASCGEVLTLPEIEVITTPAGAGLANSGTANYWRLFSTTRDNNQPYYVWYSAGTAIDPGAAGGPEEALVEVTTVRCPRGSSFASTGNADYWRLNSPQDGSDFYIWYTTFSLTASAPGSPPEVIINVLDPLASGFGVRVIYGSTTEVVSSAVVASLTAVAIDRLGDFNAVAVAETVTISSFNTGSTLDSTNPLTVSGLVVTTTQQGTNGGGIGIQVSASTVDTDTTVATVTALAINAIEAFSASRLGAEIAITTLHTGSAQNVADVNAGITASVRQAGSN